MLPDHPLAIRRLLAQGPMTAREMAQKMAVSQPTVSRALLVMGDEVLRFGPYRSIQYALHRPLLDRGDIPVFRVSPTGQLTPLGQLAPVHPCGYVMRQDDGQTPLYSEGFPWWLDDMRPQGFLGRAFVAAQAARLGLPPNLGDWQEAHVLRALLSPGGSDTVGNLLLGEAARERFLSQPPDEPIPARDLAVTYARLAAEASRGDIGTSSAGGEQPKFTAYATTPDGARHVLVKYTLAIAPAAPNPIAQRWADLLLAEHLAASALKAHGVAAVQTRIHDHQGQRFLEVERFDRVGPLGRLGLISLAAMDAEFVGQGTGGWPGITARLATLGHLQPGAHDHGCLLHAFGTLIGNTDMHPGNLSFVTDSGRPYALAPAYDMLPMAFAPRTSGELPSALAAARIDGRVSNAAWRQALTMAESFLTQLREEPRFSDSFRPCLAALESHVRAAAVPIGRLG